MYEHESDGTKPDEHFFHVTVRARRVLYLY